MSNGSPLANPMPWNLVASAYTDDVVPQFEPFARDALRLAAAPAGSRIIDVACGPGTLSLLAAQAGHRVDAIDFSSAMIDHLEARTRAAGITAISPRLGDGQALPFGDGEFAAGFSMFGLMFFPDRAKGFAELRRVLAPGARAVISSWLPLEGIPAMAAMFGVLREAMGQAMGTGGATAEREMPLVTEAACRAEMSASFREVEIHRIEHIQRSPSPEALWAMLERSMAPVAMMRKAVGPQRWAPFADNACAAIAKVTGPGPIEVPLQAWLSVGVAR